MDAKTSDWRPGPTVCRCCLTEGCYKDISTEYFWMGKREVYSEMLSETLNVSIAYSQSTGPNSNSRLICEPCISRLRDATDFRRQVLECEKTFMNHLDPGSSILQNELQLSLHDVKLESVKQEKKNSDDEDFDERVDFIVDNDDDDDDDLDDEPLMKLATKVPKKEDNLINLLDKSQITVKRKAAAKGKEPPAKKAKKQIILKPTSSKIVTKTAKPTASASKAPEKKKKGSIKWIKKSRIIPKYGDVRHNVAIILECSNVCAFKYSRNTFGCAYCTLQSPDFRIIKNHTKNHTDNRADILRNLREENMCKVDVTDLKCELCHKDIIDIPSLFDHLIEEHNKPLIKKYRPGILPYLLLGDDFACADCGLKFDKFKNLTVHLNQHYPNFICDECGQGFTEIYKLKVHRKIHTKSKLVECSLCYESFTPGQKKRHMMSKHNVGSLYRCPYCPERFKEYRHRLAHIKNSHGKVIEYPCTVCHKIFDTSCSRRLHTRRIHQEKMFSCDVCGDKFATKSEMELHMVKHGGEKCHQCTVCKKSYARKKTLVQHMRIHNNDRRFVCPHCSSAFVQNCSLKSHMKTHHASV